jgi:hypothetical protein
MTFRSAAKDTVLPERCALLVADLVCGFMFDCNIAL